MEMGKKTLKVLFFSLLFFVFLQPTSSKALEAEVIHSYHSDIVINSDATMQVTETIEVTCSNVSIIHGIYRDFPTKYKDSSGNNVNVGLEVVQVQRDGKDETYSVSSMANGKRIRIGEKDVTLAPGRYTYRIVYNTYRQLGYFENNDELFWNVTGNGWMFPIISASATITLPVPLNSTTSKLGGYTGAMGATDQNLQYSISSDGKAVFNSTIVLGQGDGMSVFVTFPKGIVKEPDARDKVRYWVKDNFFACFLMIGALLSLIIYLYGWMKYGIDPKKGTIIPLFTPPRNLSPEDLRYIKRMGFDNKTLTAAIINMAVKGYLRIEEIEVRGKTNYLIRITNANYEQLTDIEKTVAADLPSELELKKKYNPVMTTIIRNMNRSLQKKYSKIYFVWNAKFIAMSLAVSFVTFIFAFVFLQQSASLAAIIPGILLILPHFFFWALLKAPTKEGRRVLDEVEGFKRFLMVTEKDRMNLLNPPARTPELFEKYLPYALALDVEQKWAEQFTSIFKRMADEGHSYSPIWYSGAAWNMHHTSGFAHSLNSSFSSSISAASTAPGSSSGGSGGSGGGGGGGGGGGW